MPWVSIKNYCYYRRSTRVNGRVINQHVGAGQIGLLAADADELQRSHRMEEQRRSQLAFENSRWELEAVFRIEAVLKDLFAILALLHGYCLHHRQWRCPRRSRKMNGTKPPTSGTGTGGNALDSYLAGKPAALPIDLASIPEADRALLRKASAGDPTSLEAAQRYLTDPTFIKQWGNPMFAARCWLVSQIAGNDAVVAHLTQARMKMLQSDLGFDQASILEKMAITRVVHNWLTVAALEVQVCSLEPTSRERVFAERSLSQAERRLFQAIKVLAFLRNCDVGELLAIVK